MIKGNIEYDYHMQYGEWQNKELYDELFEVICDIVCVKHTTVRIAGEDYPYNLVRSKFRKLNSGHLEYERVYFRFGDYAKAKVLFIVPYFVVQWNC